MPRENTSGIVKSPQENKLLRHAETLNKKPRGAKQLTVAEVQRLLMLRCKGETINAIARITGHHWSTIQRYLNEAVPGHPLTPLEDRVEKLRERMMKVTEFDLKGSLLGDLVMLDEYRDQMIAHIARGNVPATCDALELKRIVDTKATIARLPHELGKKQTDVDDQIQGRLAERERAGAGLGVTDFTVLEDDDGDELDGAGDELSTPKEGEEIRDTVMNTG